MAPFVRMNVHEIFKQRHRLITRDPICDENKTTAGLKTVKIQDLNNIKKSKARIRFHKRDNP